MIIVSFEVKDIPVEFVLCGFLLFVSIALTGLLIIKLIAIIIASSRRVVLFPASKAYPTKIMCAELAGDVVATLVFFNRSAALLVRAHFGVRDDPV